MSKLVILILQEGNFQQGFRALLQIRGDDPPTETQIQIPGILPPAPEIPELLNRWRANFQCVKTSRLEAISSQVVSPDPEVAEELASRLNEWLNSGDKQWRNIRDLLLQNTHEQTRILLETEDIHLRRIPWHTWDLFAQGNYKKTDIALSPRSYQRPHREIFSSKTIKILAVLGYATHLQLDLDRQVLEGLGDRQGEITILQQPTPEQLRQCLRQQSWHIFFFAGHSQSDEQGTIGRFKLNQTEWMAIADLKNALDIAINENGLQLAIFNSCDGLGLANQLTQLHLPQSIVMREPVPDEVATKFLQEFLWAFANDESFYASVRYARGVLEDAFHPQYPGVSWLPVISQNPSGFSPTWQQWLNSGVSLDVFPQVYPKVAVNYLSNYPSNERPIDAKIIRPQIAIKLGIYLSAISTLSLLSSYVWVNSQPWIASFGERGWIIELAQSMILIVGIIYLIASKFSQETREFFSFRQTLPDPLGIFSLFRVFIALFSLAVAGLLLEHHLWTGPNTLYGKYQLEFPKTDIFSSYYLPYLLYLPYSTINFGLAVWIFAGAGYAAIKDLLLLRSQSLNIKYQIESLGKSLMKNEAMGEHIIEIFQKYCYDLIYLIKRYTSLFSGLATVVLFQTSIHKFYTGQNILSEAAKAWFWIGVIVVAIVLMIIFWGFYHYETVFQETSHGLSKFKVNYQDFETQHNSWNVVKRICRANLSIYLGLFMFFLSLMFVFLPKN
ncbi:CHAT domain-containing protein [Oscillatoria sp. HE19RPO]|uniref:CHAT domain-containing protein n=1 Tax=Oscillatoria sp. HE19RPO TaxID=2954806 RepID=UPI0020C38262|nr:CHAT domain-containing protein [Oscillatoria sp. HE19RPO]